MRVDHQGDVWYDSMEEDLLQKDYDAAFNPLNDIFLRQICIRGLDYHYNPTACMHVMRQQARNITLINGRREGFRFVFIV